MMLELAHSVASFALLTLHSCLHLPICDQIVLSSTLCGVLISWFGAGLTTQRSWVWLLLVTVHTFTLSADKPRQVVCTRVPLIPSSIIWYRSDSSDSILLEGSHRSGLTLAMCQRHPAKDEHHIYISSRNMVHLLHIALNVVSDSCQWKLGIYSIHCGCHCQWQNSCDSYFLLVDVLGIVSDVSMFFFCLGHMLQTATKLHQIFDATLWYSFYIQFCWWHHVCI